MSTVIVGFGNKARHGKDTAVAHIIKTYGPWLDIRRYAFADALKGELYDSLCDPLHPYWGTPWGRDYLVLPHPPASLLEVSLESKVEWINSHRAAFGTHLQTYSTEFRRAQKESYWVEKVGAQIIKDKAGYALISDMRLPNEYLFVGLAGGYTVRVTREGFIDKGRNPNHTSETALDKAVFDFDITVAEGDLDGLKSDAEQVFRQIIRTEYDRLCEDHPLSFVDNNKFPEATTFIPEHDYQCRPNILSDLKRRFAERFIRDGYKPKGPIQVEAQRNFLYVGDQVRLFS